MAKKCPCCDRGDLVPVGIPEAELAICDRCHAAVFPESKILALARRLLRGTVRRWRDRLASDAEPPVPTAPLCPEHGVPMKRGVLKGFARECWRADGCCDRVLLDSREMVPVLDLLEASAIGEAEHRTPAGFNPLMFVSRWLFRGERRDAEMADGALGLDDAQYSVKFAGILDKEAR